MKIRIQSLGMATLCLLAVSCSDYLKEDSGDLLIPEKVDEFQSVLYGEGYPNTFVSDVAWMDLMTDDVEVSKSVDENDTDAEEGDDNVNLPTGRGAFCWAYNIENYVTEYAQPYENRYANIMACNIVIEAANTMTGSEAEINACVAQAYTLRAYSYFCLLNWYGQPYNKETADTDLGVVVRLQSEVVRDWPTRSTVAEVYQQINDDLDKALELFETAKTSNSLFIVNKNVALLLKSRVALFTEQWDDVITYASQLFEDGYSLTDISGMSADELNYDGGTYYTFLNGDNPEILFTFGADDESMMDHPYMHYASMMAGASFAPSQTNEEDLILQYEEGDNRIYAFFRQNEVDYDEDWGFYWEFVDHRHVPCKHYGYFSSTQCYSQAFRTAEGMLNMAEAYIQRGTDADKQSAIDLLNELRKTRFTTDTYQAKTEADFASTDELLEFARAERRRELCFDETHRWWDLRRYGMPEIVHNFTESSNIAMETYVLRAGSPNYVLALPKSETDYNKEIEIYDRETINPE